jgi:hypothetical protein
MLTGQYIMTISDLMSRQSMLAQQLIADTAALQPLANPLSNNNVISAALVKWASEGFPSKYTLLNMGLSLHGIAMNPERSNTYTYASKIIGVDLSQAVTNFGSNFSGMKFSYMTIPNSVMVLVSKCD